MEKVLFVGTFEDQAAAAAEFDRLQEEFIADCMRGAGFEYQPYIGEIDPDLLDSLREERARVEIGYGVATSLLVQLSLDPDLVWETTRGRVDLACSADLGATLRIVQDQYESEWIEQNELLLAELISGS